MRSMISNFSEIAPLRRVLVHRPGEEFLNLTPNTLDRLLLMIFRILRWRN